MTDPKYSLDANYYLYNNTTGDVIKVIPSTDGLPGLTEIQQQGAGQKSPDSRITLETEEVKMLIEALTLRLADIANGRD